MVGQSLSQRHKRNIFQEGQSHFSHFFPGTKGSFSPVEISILVDPKQISVVSKSDQQKKKKKKERKKGPPLYFVPFPF